MISATFVVEICEEVQGLIQIIIVLLSYLSGRSSHLNLSCLCSALTSSHSHIFPTSLLHQHSCLDRGSHRHLLRGNELAHSAIMHALILAQSTGQTGQPRVTET